MKENMYSPDELREMIPKMAAVSSDFYGKAVMIGVHPFIEFCGLMNKYIDLCREAVAQGYDFASTSVHGSTEALKMETHHASYLAEKFACIFSPYFARAPKLWRTFVQHVEAEMQQQTQNQLTSAAESLTGWKVRAETHGGHVHLEVWSALPGKAPGKAGGLVVRVEEWPALEQALVLFGAEVLHSV